MKRVLITGCSGYIGSHLCKRLESEYEVYGLDIRPNEHPVKHFFQVDINRPLEVGFEFDAVVHLAGLVNVGQSEQMPIQYYITNLNGTMNVLNKIKTKNFIFSSTGTAELCQSAYGISKRAAEDVVKEYCTIHNPTPYTIFRFYNVIGSSGYAPTNPDGLMYNLMKAKDRGSFTIFGNDYETKDGTCMRDYVHVLEICEAIKTAIEQPANGLENLGHGFGMSVNDMVRAFKNVNKVDFNVEYGPRRKGDAAVSVLQNPSKYMKSLFAFEELLKVDNDNNLL